MKEIGLSDSELKHGQIISRLEELARMVFSDGQVVLMGKDCISINPTRHNEPSLTLFLYNNQLQITADSLDARGFALVLGYTYERDKEISQYLKETGINEVTIKKDYVE